MNDVKSVRVIVRDVEKWFRALLDMLWIYAFHYNLIIRAGDNQLPDDICRTIERCIVTTRSI